jgi:two-component system, NtrC family, sensor kinase
MVSIRKERLSGWKRNNGFVNEEQNMTMAGKNQDAPEDSIYTEGLDKEESMESYYRKLADKELLRRPSFGFRAQIIVAFMIIFFLALGITAGAMVAVDRIQAKISLMQSWDGFLFNIEQARRWEKNFFLYGTNMEDALQNARQAQEILGENMENISRIASPERIELLENHMKTYLSLLVELRSSQDAVLGQEIDLDDIENKLRGYGAKMVEAAVELVESEQSSINSLMNLLQKVPVIFMVGLLFLTFYVAHFLSRRFMGPLNRLISHTRRIAQGDFTPIMPVYKYRDEFTIVELAINRMLNELEHHHESMVESHKQRAIGTLTAGVAHELNNPLNNIMLTAHTLLEDFQEVSDVEKIDMLKDIIGETDRSRNIVRNLLDFTRESESVSEVIDLGTLVRSTTSLALNQAKVSGIDLDVDVDPGLPHIRGDKQQLKQVFLNLIINALDAVESVDRERKVLVTVKKHPSTRGFLNVCVHDNGEGIAEPVKARIFDPFFTTKPVGKGNGLGLSVSQGIVKKHGGRIEVQSQEGQYTKFNVVLPYDRYSRGY